MISRIITRDIYRSIYELITRYGNIFSPSSISSLFQYFLDSETPYSDSTLNNISVLSNLEDSDSYRIPLKGRSWLFDGTNDYGEASATNIISSNMSYGGWVKVGNWAGLMNHTIVAKGTNSQWSLFLVGGNIALRVGASSDVIFSHLGLSAGWHHVFATINGTTGTIYVDGVSVASGTVIAMPANNSALVNVGRFSSGVYYFTGSMFDIRIYNVAKSAAEVLSIYNQASTPYTIDTTGLLAHYWCNEEAGTTGFDSSGNDNHLTLTGITPATFHAVDQGISYNPANNIGYTQGIVFDGTNDYAATPGKLTSTATNSVTAWVRCNNTATKMIAGEWTGSVSTSNFFFGVHVSGSLIFAVYNGGLTTQGFSSGIIPAYIWTHVAVTWNASTVTFYINGVASGSFAASPMNTNNTEFSVSKAAVSLPGSITDVRLYNVVKSEAEIANISTGAADTTGLVAQYYGNDDVSGNRNNLTLTNGASVISIPQDESDTTKSISGSSLQHTGQSPYPATIESPCVRLDGTNDFGTPQSNFPTITEGAMYAIMKPDSGSGVQYLIAASDPNRMYLGLSSTNQIYIYLGSTLFTHTVVETDWVKVGVSWSGGNYKVFRNGVLISSSTYSGSIGGGTSRIGSYNGNTTFFKGYASDVRIYNTAKSDAEILAITNGNADMNGLYAWWPLQEGGGLVSYDISGNGNHLNWSGITESTFWGTRNSGLTQDVSMLYGGRWAGENRVLGSEALHTTPWLTSSNAGGITVTGNSTTAPDGSSRGCTISYPSVSGSGAYAVRYIISTDVLGYINTAQYTWSIWLKGDVGGEEVWLMEYGTIRTSQKCVLTNEWVRYNITFSGQSSTYIMIGIDLRELTQTATPAQTIYAWGSQISASTEVLPYTRTYSVAQTSRSYVPGSPLGSYCVDTLDLVSAAGKYSNPYSRLNHDPYDAAEYNALTIPSYEALPCLTGNSSNNYVDLGSPLIPATADFHLSFWYYHEGNAFKGLFSQGANAIGRFYVFPSTTPSSNSMILNCPNFTDSIELPAALSLGAWNYIEASRVGSQFSLTVTNTNIGIKTGSFTDATPISIASNTELLTIVSGYFNNGRIAYLTLTSGGVTKEIPLTDGSGSNLALYTDGVESILSAAIKGTLTNVWANTTDARMPSTDNAFRAIVPRNTKFRRTDTDGDDRFVILRNAATGADLTNLIEYTS